MKIILLLCIIIELTVQIQLRRILSNCKPTVEILCNEDEKHFTYFMYHKRATITPGCAKNTFTTEWTLRSGQRVVKRFAEQTQHGVVIIPARCVPAGNYTLRLVVSEQGGSKTTVTCPMHFVTEPPVLMCVNGLVQFVLAGAIFKVDFRPSRFHGNLYQIKWSVRCVYTEKNYAVCQKIAPCKFPTMKGMYFTGVINACWLDVVFTATVTHDGQGYQREHHITTRDAFACAVDVICEKNCGLAGSGLTNPAIATAFTIRPSNSFCQGLAKWRPEWNVNVPLENNRQLPQDQFKVINNNHRMIITEDQLEFSKIYFVNVKVEKIFISMLQVETTPQITPPTCTIEPTSGVSLETVFTVHCDVKDPHLKMHGAYYQLYQTIGDKKHLVIATANSKFQMVLSAAKGQPSQELTIEGRDIFHNTFTCEIPSVAVSEIQIEPKMEEIGLKMTTATAKADPFSLQYAQGLINEILQSDMPPKEVRKNLAQLLKRLGQVSMDTVETYEQVTGMLATFLDVSPMTVAYKQNLAKFCKKLAAVHVEILLKSEYVRYQGDTAKKQAKLNTDCADKLLEKTVEEEMNSTTTTTVLPQVDEAVAVEDYPDYQLPFATPEVEEVKHAGMDVIQNEALAVSKTLTVGEEHVQESEHSTTLVVKNDGKYLADRQLEVANMTVVPDKVFSEKYAENEVTAIISNYDRDVLTPMSDLSGRIVDVAFFTGKKRLVNVSYSMDFEVDEEPTEFDRYTLNAYGGGDDWTLLDRHMNVHRLNLYALQTCLVRFRVENGTKLKVGMSVNRRPRAEHFKAPSGFVVLPEDQSTWAIQNPYSRSPRDTLFYVAVYQHPDMSTAMEYSYELQFTTVACVTYHREKHKWQPASTCEPTITGGETNATVHCKCLSTSLHSITYKLLAEHRLEKQRTIEITIEDFVNYTIFLHVFVTLVCYLIALALSLQRQPKLYGRDKICFLADNRKNDLYCYMLVVRTGAFYDAGTTANVMIQLVGADDRQRSKPHVLNYPDPACKLLQRDGVDWLVLAHSAHLGALSGIVLWTDSIGLYPPWYCEDINVFDMQKRDEAPYYFCVRQWLSVLPKHQVHVRVMPSDPQTKVKVSASHLVQYLHFHWNGRHTWNIFVRDDYELGYIERLTVVLSMIWTNYMLAIWVLGAPRLTHADAFGYGHYVFMAGTQFIYAFALSLLVSSMHMPIVYFLRNSWMTNAPNTLVVKIKRYPYKVRRGLCYGLIAWLCLCFCYLIIFGFWMTYHTVFRWMVITFVSLVFSIFLWENLFHVLVDIITSHKGIREELVYHFGEILIEVERQRVVLYRLFGELLLRPYFKNHYRFLTPNEIFYLRNTIKKRYKVGSLFKDMCLFLLFVGVLYLICMVRFDQIINKSNLMMRRMMVESIYANRTHLLHDIESTDDIYDYLEHVIIPTMHPVRWYGEWYSSDAGVMADYATRVLGVVQLRQQRRQQRCAVPYQLKDLQIPCSNEAPVFDEWEYNSGADISATIGHLKIYDGSGYIAYLGRTRTNSLFILNLLRKNRWIDVNTAVLFIDFLTYNANLNMFNAVRICIERSPSGKLLKLVRIYTVQLIYANLFMEMVSAALLVLLTILICVMITKRFVQIILTRGNFFKNFWNILDIILSLLSFILIVLFFHTKHETYKVLQQIVDVDHNKFVNYYHLMTLAQATTITYAVTVAFATLRLWKFLHFGVLFRIMERTILQSGPQFFGLFLYQVIVYMMMAIFMYPLYGENLVHFRDFYTALVTLFLASFNFTEHLPAIYMDTQRTSLYLIYSFFLVVSVGFMNLYTTTLMMNLEESRIYYSNSGEKSVYTIHNYVLDVGHFYKEKWRRHLESTRLKGGGVDEPSRAIDVDRLIYAKSDEHRYADIVSMSATKMELMRIVALVTIKNMRKQGRRNDMGEDDLLAMARVVIQFFGQQQKSNDDVEGSAHVFFKVKDPQQPGIFRFVPDTKMVQMEMVLKKLLAGRGEEIQLQENTGGLYVHASGDLERMKYIEQCLQLIANTVQHIVIKKDKKNRKKSKTE